MSCCRGAVRALLHTFSHFATHEPSVSRSFPSTKGAAMTGVRRWVVGAVVVTAALAAMDARADASCSGSFYACPIPQAPEVSTCFTSCPGCPPGDPNLPGRDPAYWGLDCETGAVGGDGGCSCAGAAQPIPRQTCAGTCTFRQCDPSASQPLAQWARGRARIPDPRRAR